MRIWPLAILSFAGCASTPPPPPPPPFDGYPFRHSVTLEGVGCTEFYSLDEARSLRVRKRYTRPGDPRYSLSTTEVCDQTEAWGLCTLKLKERAILSYLYMDASKRQTGYHCRQTGGRFTELK